MGWLIFEFSTYPQPAGGAVLWGRAEESREPTRANGPGRAGCLALTWGFPCPQGQTFPLTTTSLDKLLQYFITLTVKVMGVLSTAMKARVLPSVPRVSRQSRFPDTRIWGGNNYVFSTLFSSKHRGDAFNIPGAGPVQWQQGSAQTRGQSSTEQTGWCDTLAFQKPRCCSQTSPEEQTTSD